MELMVFAFGILVILASFAVMLAPQRLMGLVEGVLHPFGYSLWNIDSGERLSWLEVHSIERDREATVATFALPAD